MSAQFESFVMNEYVKNPIMYRKVIEGFLKQAKERGENEAEASISRVMRAIELSDEKRLRQLKAELFLDGGNPDHAQLLVHAFDMVSNNELSNEDFLKMLEKIFAPTIAEQNTELKFDIDTLKRLGRILADNGYIRKVDATSFHLMQGGMKWLKPKTMLVYLIEQIRSDGKCPYKETGLMFNVNLNPNNKKGGYNEIDEMIKMATLK